MKQPRRFLVLVVFLLCACGGRWLWGKNIYFEVWNQADGLLGDRVKALIQDKNGFMWIGTDDGVQRFDGYGFTEFVHDPDNPAHSINASEVLNFAIDSAGGLWVCQRTGLTWIQRETGQIESMSETVDRGLQKEFYYFLHRVFVDGAGRLWVASGSGLWRCFPESGTVKKMLGYEVHPDPAKQHELRRRKEVIEVGDCMITINNLGIDALNSLCRIGGVSEFKSSQLADVLGNIGTIFYDGDNTIWFSVWGLRNKMGKTVSGKQVFRYFMDGNRIQHYDAIDVYASIANPPATVFAIHKDQNGNIWFATGGAGLICQTRSGAIFHYKYEVDNPHGLPSNMVLCIYEDRQGNLWFGTDKGLCRVRRFSQHLHTIEPTGTSPNQILCMEELPDGRIAMGTHSDGLRVLDSTMHLTNHFPDRFRNGIRTRIWSILFCGQEQILMSTDTGLYVADLNLNKLTRLPSRDSPTLQFNDLAYDHEGRIWGAEYHGQLVEIDMQKGVIQQFPLPHNNTGQKANVSRLQIDAAGKIWVAAKGQGFHVFDPASKKFTDAYLQDAKAPNSMISSEIDDFRFHGDSLYAITHQGLFILDIARRQYINFNQRNGLASNKCYGLVENAQGTFFWVYTQNGFSRYDPSTHKFLNFTYRDGLTVPKLDQGAFIKLRSGNILFGGNGRLYRLDPNDFFTALPGFPLQFTTASIYGHPVSIDSVQRDHAGVFFVSHHTNLFHLSFVSPTYEYRHQIQYQYRLEGWDAAWIDANESRSATYSGVDGGKYEFQVRCSDVFGNWREDVLRLPVLISTPFWQQLWVQISGIVLIVMMVFGIVVVRIRSIRRSEHEQRRIQGEIYELERQALTLQMNPHFIFNCMNSVNRYVLENDSEKASRFLTRFAKLIRITLENSRLSLVSLAEEVEALTVYLDLEAMRLKGRFTHTCALAPSVDAARIVLPPMLLQPFVENAVWHGMGEKEGQGNIRLGFEIVEQSLVFVVEDDGMGRQRGTTAGEASKHQSIGTKVTARRLELLAGYTNASGEVTTEDLLDAHGLPAGTRVTVRIPLVYGKGSNA